MNATALPKAGQTQTPSIHAPAPVEHSFLKTTRASLVIVHFASGTFLDSNDYDVFATYKDHMGKYTKINVRDATESFFKLYHGDGATRYQAIDRFNPSHYIHFTGKSVERLESKREKV